MQLATCMAKIHPNSVILCDIKGVIILGKYDAHRTLQNELICVVN